MEVNTPTNENIINRKFPDFTQTKTITREEANEAVARKSEKNKRKKPTEKFSEMYFLAAHLAEHFGLSKPTIYELTGEGVIKPAAQVKRGNINVAVYGWDAVETLSNRYKDRIGKTGTPRIATVANMKGGTGKSTVTTQVGMTAASMGFKTLILDFDPQSHASKAVHFDGVALRDLPTIKDVIISDVPIKEAIIEITPMLHLLPANLRLSRLELEMYPLHNREELIRSQLCDIAADFDVVLIDTNPSASLLNVSSIAASDEVWIVTETDHFSTDGLATVFDVLKSIHKSFKRCPQVKVIANQFDVREGMAWEAVGFLKAHFSDVLAPTIVSKCQDIKEAQKRKQAIWQYNRKSVGAKEIFELTRNLLNIKGVSNA